MLDQKTKEYNWYYTQNFVKVPDETFNKLIRFITFADTPTEAKELALKECNRRVPNNDGVETHLYQKNYIREARHMVDRNNFVGVRPAGV